MCQRIVFYWWSGHVICWKLILNFVGWMYSIVFSVYDAFRYCSIARGEGAALLLQPSPAALAIFEILGRCVKVESEEKFRYLACVAWIFSYKEGTHMIHMMIIWIIWFNFWRWACQLVTSNELMKIGSLPSGFGTYGELLQAAAHTATVVEVWNLFGKCPVFLDVVMQHCDTAQWHVRDFSVAWCWPHRRNQRFHSSLDRSHGVEDDISSAWIGASYAAFAADSATAEADTFQRLLNEQTPGGLNEKARAGCVLHGVDLLLLNFVGIWSSPGLAIVGWWWQQRGFEIFLRSGPPSLVPRGFPGNAASSRPHAGVGVANGIVNGAVVLAVEAEEKRLQVLEAVFDA